MHRTIVQIGSSFDATMAEAALEMDPHEKVLYYTDNAAKIDSQELLFVTSLISSVKFMSRR